MQTCSELVLRIGHDKDTMFQASPFNLNNYIKDCKNLFGVLPQPQWITTYYGGHVYIYLILFQLLFIYLLGTILISKNFGRI